jgi:hypothetical protein
MTSKLPSSTLNTGFHSTPVLSIATCRTPSAVSQSAGASNAFVVVSKVRTSLVRRRPLPGRRTQATTVAWWTSSPQHRA